MEGSCDHLIGLKKISIHGVFKWKGISKVNCQATCKGRQGLLLWVSNSSQEFGEEVFWTYLSFSASSPYSFFAPRSLDSSLALDGVVVTSPPSQQIDFRAELVSLLDNQIRYLH